MKTLLISLVSDQTIPNVQLIRDFYSEGTEFQFITTKRMEEKGCRKWIEKAANIKSVTNPIVVNEYSYDDIKNKLNEFDFSAYKKLIVNLTGGTKVMTIAAHDFFKEEGADIFYVTGIDKKIIKIFPGENKLESTIKNSLSVEEYLVAYGFNIQRGESKHFHCELTQKMFDLFCSGEIEVHSTTLNYLRQFRAKGLKQKDYNEDVTHFIKTIKLVSEKENSLSVDEVKFLTGEWFEQYVYDKVKKSLGLDDSKILMGIKLNKEIKDNESSIVKKLLQTDDVLVAKPDNEIDVIFMFNGSIYIIECKTSIVDIQEVEIERNGLKTKKTKEINFLGETIYKSDSIREKFGLFAKSYIFTMTDFKQYTSAGSLIDSNNKKRKMEELINRATLSKISIIDRHLLASCESIKQLL